MYIKTYRQTDTDRPPTDRQIDLRNDRHMDIQKDRVMDRLTEGCVDEQIDK